MIKKRETVIEKTVTINVFVCDRCNEECECSFEAYDFKTQKAVHLCEACRKVFYTWIL